MTFGRKTGSQSIEKLRVKMGRKTDKLMEKEEARSTALAKNEKLKQALLQK